MVRSHGAGSTRGRSHTYNNTVGPNPHSTRMRARRHMYEHRAFVHTFGLLERGCCLLVLLQFVYWYSFSNPRRCSEAALNFDHDAQLALLAHTCTRRGQ